MLLVIFGAGASFDCAPLYPNPNIQPDEFRMPLANFLFANTKNCSNAWNGYPEIRPVVPRLTNLHYANSDSIEKRLETLLVESATDDERLKQLLAIRYYISEVISQYQNTTMNKLINNISGYEGLIDSIRHRRGKNGKVCFVSFNYDTLLEQAFAIIDVPMTSSLEEHISNPNWKLIKPHGSISWSRIAHLRMAVPPRDLRTHELIANAKHLELTESYRFGTMNPVDQYYSIPAIAVPFESKDDFECPKEHQEELIRSLPDVKGVLMVGWRATEDKFLNLLGNKLPKNIEWLNVNPSMHDAMTAQENLEKKGRVEGKFTTLNNGFSSFVGNNLGDAFFERVFNTSEDHL